MYLSNFKGFIRLHEICPTPEEPLVGPRALSAYSRSKRKISGKGTVTTVTTGLVWQVWQMWPCCECDTLSKNVTTLWQMCDKLWQCCDHLGHIVKVWQYCERLWLVVTNLWHVKTGYDQVAKRCGDNVVTGWDRMWHVVINLWQGVTDFDNIVTALINVLFLSDLGTDFW